MNKSDKFKAAKFVRIIVVKHFFVKNGQNVNYEELTFTNKKSFTDWVKTIDIEDVFFAHIEIPFIKDCM